MTPLTFAQIKLTQTHKYARHTVENGLHLSLIHDYENESCETAYDGFFLFFTMHACLRRAI
jgi:hypothetical protein